MLSSFKSGRIFVWRCDPWVGQVTMFTLRESITAPVLPGRPTGKVVHVSSSLPLPSMQLVLETYVARGNTSQSWYLTRLQLPSLLRTANVRNSCWATVVTVQWKITCTLFYHEISLVISLDEVEWTIFPTYNLEPIE